MLAENLQGVAPGQRGVLLRGLAEPPSLLGVRVVFGLETPDEGRAHRPILRVVGANPLRLIREAVSQRLDVLVERPRQHDVDPAHLVDRTAEGVEVDELEPILGPDALEQAVGHATGRAAVDHVGRGFEAVVLALEVHRAATWVGVLLEHQYTLARVHQRVARHQARHARADHDRVEFAEVIDLRHVKPSLRLVPTSQSGIPGLESRRIGDMDPCLRASIPWPEQFARERGKRNGNGPKSETKSRTTDVRCSD